jgi:hypothetical protein
LAALPLFTLQTPLFPDGSMPLRIFEVRYLDMIGRRHKAGEPFGVVCLSEGSDTRRRASGKAGAKPSGDGFANEAFSGRSVSGAVEPCLLRIRAILGPIRMIRELQQQPRGGHARTVHHGVAG